MLSIKPNNWGITNYQQKVNLPQTNFDLKIISHQFRSKGNTNLKDMKSGDGGQVHKYTASMNTWVPWTAPLCPLFWNCLQFSWPKL